MNAFEGLEFLTSLDAPSRQCLLTIAEDIELSPGDEVLAAGCVPDALWLVTEGVLELRNSTGQAQPLTRLGPGSLVGELSMALACPATASIAAVERTMALRLPRRDVERLIDADPMFAASFWRAVAMTVSARLTATTAAWTNTSRLASARSTIPTELRDALDAFQHVLTTAAAGEGEMPWASLDSGLAAVGDALNNVLAEPGLAADVFDQVRAEILSTARLSPFVRRVWEKPNGYAGDWETIEMMYRNEPAGVGRLGQAIDGVFLRLPPVVAARNRRELLAEQIAQASARGPAAIASLACGPAREITDVLDRSPEMIAQVSLLDLDPTAIENAREQIGRRRMLDRATFYQSNLIKLALGREELTLPPQDLVYSIGLIDYLPDDLVIALLNVIHPWLRPGGRVILGNFDPANPARGLMELFDWSLIHRTPDDMDRLYEQSAFGRPCDEILWEDQHINLFAVGVRH